MISNSALRMRAAARSNAPCSPSVYADTSPPVTISPLASVRSPSAGGGDGLGGGGLLGGELGGGRGVGVGGGLGGGLGGILPQPLAMRASNMPCARVAQASAGPHTAYAPVSRRMPLSLLGFQPYELSAEIHDLRI